LTLRSQIGFAVHPSLRGVGCVAGRLAGWGRVAQHTGAVCGIPSTVRRPVEPPLTGTAAAARQWPGVSRERAQQIALLWTQHGFTDTEAAAWWSPDGLRSGDMALASLLREHGIRSDHMRERAAKRSGTE
jgi:hypothetical protein